MKKRSRRSSKLIKREQAVLTNVARTIGSSLGTLAATTDRLRKKSLAIGAQARTVARKTRKQFSSVTRRARTARRTGTPRRKS